MSKIEYIYTRWKRTAIAKNRNSENDAIFSITGALRRVVTTPAAMVGEARARWCESGGTRNKLDQIGKEAVVKLVMARR